MRVHLRNNRDPLGRQVFARRDRRQRLLAVAMATHGVAGVGLLLEQLENTLGIDLGIDALLEHLVDANPAAVALLAAQKDARR